MKTLLLSALAAVVMLCSVGCAPQSSPTYRLYAKFQKVQGLKPGDQVVQGGKQIGRVTAITLDPAAGDVRITMAITRSAVVKTDSTAAIVSPGPPASSLVVLSSGSAGAPQADDGTFLLPAGVDASE